jgi:YD repeat-containing protein
MFRTFRRLLNRKPQSRPAPVRRARPTLELLERRELLAQLTFLTQPLGTAAGLTLNPITVSSSDGGTAPITVSLGNNQNGLQLQGTVTKNAVNGQATFRNLVLAGGNGEDSKNLVLIASSGTDTATSNAFVVKPGADHLFIAALSTTAAGANLGPVTVQVLDADGSVTREDSTTQVQLYIDHNPGGAQFIDANGKPIPGPLTATVKQGVATFADVRLDKAGVGYTLGVQPVNNALLPQTTSNAFVVSAAQPDHLAFVNQPTYTGTTDTINVYGGNLGFHTWTGVTAQVVDKFGNPVAGLVTTSLGAAIGTSDTSLTVASANGFPPTGSFNIQIDSEIMTVTAGAGTNTWTVTRGVYGTTPAAHAQNAAVQLVTTTKLNAALGATDTSLTVASAAGFPTTGPFNVQVGGEQMTVTAVAGNTWTVTRGVNSNPNITPTILTADITAAALTLTVANAATFPTSGPFNIQIDNEVMTVTGGFGTTTWTVTRGTNATAHAKNALVQGTTKATHAAGTTIQLLSMGTATVAAFDGTGSPTNFVGGSITTVPIDLNGVAAFTNLKISTQGNGYTLAATGSVQVNGQTIPLANATTVVSSTTTTLTVNAAGSFPSSNGFSILLTQGATSKVFQVTAGAGTTTWTVNGDPSGFTAGAAVTLLSTPFNVGPVRGKLQFDPTAPPPTSAKMGVTLAPIKVDVVDAAGHIITADNTDSITLQGGNWNGTRTVTVVNGVATFSDLEINPHGLPDPGFNATFQFDDLDSGFYGGPISQSINLLPGDPYRLAFANTVLHTGNNPAKMVTAGEFIQDGTNRDIRIRLVDQAGNLINNTELTKTGTTTGTPNVISVSDTTGLSVGMIVQGAGIPPPTIVNNIPTYTTITKISGTNLTVSNPTKVAPGTTLRFDPNILISLGVLPTNGRGPVFMGQSPTTTLSAAIGTSDTSLTVASANGFPPTGSFNIQIDSEIMTVTAGAGTNTWTVTRGAYGTTAAAHAQNAAVQLLAGDPAGLHTDVEVLAINGTADFHNVYMDYVGSQYILAAGTASFSTHGQADTSDNPFTIVPNAPVALIFPVNSNSPPQNVLNSVDRNRLNAANPVITTIQNVNGPTVEAVDKAGNVATSFDKQPVTLSLAMGNPNDLMQQTGNNPPVAGPITINAVKGIAVFNMSFIHNTATTASTYQLQATTTVFTNPAITSNLSSTFTVSPSQRWTGIPGVRFLDPTVGGKQTAGVPFNVTLQLTDNGVDTANYNSFAHVLLELRDANGNPLPNNPNGPILVGDQSKNMPTGSGQVTFQVTIQQVAAPTTFTLLALLDLNAQSQLSNKFSDPSGSGDSSGSSSGGASDPPPNIVQVGLGSYTQNFDSITNYPAYTAIPPGKQPYPPSVAFDPAVAAVPAMSQPNAAAGFNQVPESTKWWSSLMFSRTQADVAGVLPRDSQNNQLFPLYALPLAAMVNSNGQGIHASMNDFPGLGLSYLDNLFVTQSSKFADPVPPNTPPNQPPSWVNPQFPGAASFSYPYGGSDQRLYQDFSIGLSGRTTLSTAIGNADTTLTVASAIGFPTSGPFNIQIDSEIMTVTAGAGTNTWTVTRGAGGTAAASHDANAPIQLKADGKVLSYSDSTVTLDWNGQLQATLGEGLPYVYFTAPNANGATMQLVTAPKVDDQDPSISNPVTITTYDANGNKVNSSPTGGPLMVEIQYQTHDARDKQTAINLTGNTTKGLATITGLDTSKLNVGMTVAGFGIPPKAIITSVDSATQITISIAATETATGTALTFQNWPVRTVDHFYGLFLPAGVSWSLSSNTNGTLTFQMPPQITQTAGTTAKSNVITVQDGSKLVVGMGVTGQGVPAGTTITSINGNQVTVSSAATATASGVSFTFDRNFFSVASLPAPVSATGNSTAGSFTLALADTSKLAVGMKVGGFGVQSSTTITSIDSPTQITVSNYVTGTATSGTFTFNTPALALTTFNTFRQHAYSFVTGSTSSFNFDQSTGLVTTTYALQTQVRQTGGDLIDNSPLQALYVTQYSNLSATDRALLTNISYISPRGTMQVWAGPVFHTVLQYQGTLPAVPPIREDGTSHADLWKNYLLTILQSISTQPQSDGRLVLDQIFPNDNNYLEAQSMFGASQLVPILLEISQSTDTGLSANDKAQAASYAQQIFNQIKARMGNWLSAQDDKSLKLLYYQPAKPLESTAPANSKGWESLMSILSGFLSSESLNDHQLIASYFIKTAAFLAQYDSTWGDTATAVPVGGVTKTLQGKLGDIIKLMIDDVSDYNRGDTQFPFLRNFDTYAGHSWADGAANNPDGINLESSSEALNYDAALIQWGEATGDKATRDLGVYLYTTELQSVQTYWFNVNQTDAFPPAYTTFTDPTTGKPSVVRTLATKLNGDGGSYVGFIGLQPTRVTGIQVLPLSGSAYYLGLDPNFVGQTFNLAYQGGKGGTQQGLIPIAPPFYQSVILPYEALNNPPLALTLYKANLPSIGQINPLDLIDNNAFNIHWMEGLQAYGQVDGTVTADTISYAVFKRPPGNPQAGARTFVAYNPGVAPEDVTFKDAQDKVLLQLTGAKAVPGHTLVVVNADGTIINQQTTPDFSLQTPITRFFFASAKNGTNYTFTNGKAGTGELALSDPNTVLIPPSTAAADGAPVTYQIKGVNGTLQGPDAQAFFDLWLDPQFRSTGSAPGISVSITYDRYGDGTQVITQQYSQFNLSKLDGFVEYRSPANSGMIQAPLPATRIPAYFPDLENGTITVTIQMLKGTGDGKTSVRLRTDAAAEQGRVSYLDLPYNLTAVGGQAASQLNLGGYTLGAPHLLLGAPPPPPPPTGPSNPLAGYTATLTGQTAIFSAATLTGQTLQITEDPATGLLMNNRFAAGDPGFNSPFDFDSTKPGDQTLAASAASTIIVSNSNNDSILLGDSSTPASSLLAHIILGNTGPASSLGVQDGARATQATYTVNTGGITTDDQALNISLLTGNVFSGGIGLVTGGQNNTVNVLGTRAGEPLTLNTSGGHDDVTVGAGDTRNILGDVTVDNDPTFSDLVVDNSRGVNASTNVTVSGTSITGVAPASILYSGLTVDDIDLFGGTNGSTYTITGVNGGSTLYLQTGTNANNVVIGDSGLFAGPLILLNNPGGKDSISVTPLALTEIDIDGPPPGTPPGDQLFVNLTGAVNPKLTLSDPHSGRWTFANAQPITFTNIGQFNVVPSPPPPPGLTPTSVSLTQVLVTPALSSEAVTLSAQVSGGGTVNEGTVTFSVAGHAAVARVNSNGLATALLTLPALTTGMPLAFGVTYSDNSGAFASSASGGTARFIPVEAVLPSTTKFVAGGGATITDLLFGLLSLSRSYDAQGRLTEVDLDGIRLETFGYDAQGQLAVVGLLSVQLPLLVGLPPQLADVLFQDSLGLPLGV